MAGGAGGRPREPVDLLLAKGRKHLTKAEIEARRAAEVDAPDDAIAPPPFLRAKQKKDFRVLAAQLQAAKIMKNLDCEALAAYIVERDMWLQAVKELRQARPDDVSAYETLTKIEDRYRKQMRASAADLGLTISSRCRLVMPKAEETPKENKFARFAGGDAM